MRVSHEDFADRRYARLHYQHPHHHHHPQPEAPLDPAAFHITTFDLPSIAPRVWGGGTIKINDDGVVAGSLMTSMPTGKAYPGPMQIVYRDGAAMVPTNT